RLVFKPSRSNRMLESLILSESVVNSRWFLRTSIVLFMNKVMFFKDKLLMVRCFIIIVVSFYLSLP
ncbi:hypothetical protein BDN72DRAFT_769198, partial [Pluteus cervinus]